MKIDIPLKDQVVSQKVAPLLNQALKKAGIEVVAHYWWKASYHVLSGKTEKECWKTDNISSAGLQNKKPKLYEQPWYTPEHLEAYYIPTHTLSELLAVLPEKIEQEHRILEYGRIGYMHRKNGHWLIRMSSIYYKNDATAAAKLAIWAIDNGHLGNVK